jgi:predicted double-glycine peptidase
MQCVQESIVDVEKIAAGNMKALYQTLKQVTINYNDDNYYDSNMLSRMSAANVAVEDPELTRLCSMYC